MKLLILETPQTDPLINLALERQLGDFVNSNQYILRLWHNSSSIIMGRFQNAEFEVNQDFTLKHRIPVVKRHTGGGTVYHDEGTLNISFFKPSSPLLSKDDQKDSDFITKKLLTSLNHLGIQATKDDRNSIYINDHKILGSAVALTGHIFCYHASLLFNTNLENLHNAINWMPVYRKTQKPFVKSQRSQVTNVSNFYPNVLLGEITSSIVQTLTDYFKAASNEFSINLIKSNYPLVTK
ncbi:MAG: hypothetical protein A2562_03890 [Candidatus Nealsonbacteria bacterium RIFOXYD1_FULL_39_11]|nr:MAG: hypothetical protein A2562_03890 [Candidatus Nealsonbacteria bacterium RIFOXYD1_FULL_39_11]